MDNPNGKTDQIAARLLLPLDTAKASLDLVGGKGRALVAMAFAGMPVPDGFHLTTSAYQQFVTENDLQRAILDLAKPALVESSVSFESAAATIQALFEQANLPSEIIAEIQQAYNALNERGQAPAVAVRSSANAEDLPDLSFAGQQDTYLNVRGLNALVLAIRRCWASLWNTRLLGYRHQMGIAHDAVAMAVVVQRMVEAEVSGMLFTTNPTTGDRTELVVNASYGLGEAIVGGEVTPDTYVLDRNDFSAKERSWAPRNDKSWQWVSRARPPSRWRKPSVKNPRCRFRSSANWQTLPSPCLSNDHSRLDTTVCPGKRIGHEYRRHSFTWFGVPKSGR